MFHSNENNFIVTLRVRAWRHKKLRHGIKLGNTRDSA